MTKTIGIDVGTGVVKSVLFDVDGDTSEWLAKRSERIRKRDPYKLAEETMDGILADNNLSRDDIDYIATTGEGESLEFHTGHFYSMTTHARGGDLPQPGGPFGARYRCAPWPGDPDRRTWQGA